ncbi:MAG: hypothetical protein PHI88_02690 [Candidatus Pacebacteria bacterium]|nr:hypothetical protein [Candidatus Paceibacterota bacterium]
MSFLKKIKEKSEKEKKKILFTSIIIVAIFLVLLWFLTIKYNISRINFGSFRGPEINTEGIKDAKDRLKNLRDTFNRNIKDFKGVTDELE